MFQESEIINLVLGLIGLVVLARIVERKSLPRFTFLFAGYLMLLASYTTTLIEGVFAPDFFNFLEHLFLALSGTLFAVGVWKLGKPDPAHPEAEQPR